MGRRLLQGFQKGIESSLRKHMHLIDDVHTASHLSVFASGRHVAGLLNEVPNVVYAVVGGRVELMDGDALAFIESAAGVALVAGLPLRSEVFAVDGLGQDTGTGSFAYSPGAGKQKGVSQLIHQDGSLQGIGNMGLAHHRSKSARAILACGYDVVFHKFQGKTTIFLGKERRNGRRGFPGFFSFLVSKVHFHPS
jgi:hypothetical protein